MSSEVANDAVKRRLGGAGLDAKAFGAHSLRSGFISAALHAGHPYKAVVLQTHHVSSVALEAY